MGLWRWRQAINVDAPPHEVFDYLSDFPRLSEVIFNDASLLEPDNEESERFEVGSAVGLGWMGSDQGGPTSHNGILTITEIIPYERIAWTLELKGTQARIGVPDAAVDLRPVDQGTRVDMTSQSRWPRWFNILILTLWIGFLPILLIFYRLQSRARLRRLKQGVVAADPSRTVEKVPWFRDVWTGWVLLAIGGFGLFLGSIVGLNALMESGGGGKSIPIPTGPTTPTTLPSGFVTFVDDAKHFMISYPGDWVVLPPPFGQPAQLIDPETPVFEAGRTTGDGGLMPGATVFFGFLSGSVSSDDLADANLANASLAFDGLIVHDRRHVALAGVEDVATIVEVEFPHGGVDPDASASLHGFFLFSAGGRATRVINCFSDTILDLDSCRAVVSSFAITAND